MKSLVIYDSNYGNTQKVAEVIATEIGGKAVSISVVSPSELAELDVLVVGTPIIGWKPTVKIQEFLSKLQDNQLAGISATSFDTRVKLFIHGDAMGKVADTLKRAGANILVNPMPFYVAGPQAEPYLLDGELEKAKTWANEIKNKITKE